VRTSSPAVSTGALSCCPALIVNFFWFTDEKCSSHRHYATLGHEIKCLAIQKLNRLAIGVCWCTVFLEDVKLKLSPQVCESGRFVPFCGKMVKLQQFVISEPDEVHH